MLLPDITDKQKEIIKHLYCFRFINTNQFQKLFNHLDKTTVQVWLKDLKDKRYIGKIEEKNDSFENRTKPSIYYLSLNGRHLLKKNPDFDRGVLNKVYKEKNIKPKFYNKCLSIVDMFLFFLSQREADQELEFFTENELVSYTYFPKELSAFITITTKGETERYFLDVFGPYTPAFEMRNRIKVYWEYISNGNWEANTNAEPFPAILFVCPSKNLKSHMYFHIKGKFEKAFEEKFDIYLTTLQIIRSGNKNIWEKVSL